MSWAVAAASGTPAHGTRHLFYIPVVLVAVRSGALPAAGVGVAATVLAGPLAVAAPLDVWLSRGPFFIGVGILVAMLVSGIRSAWARENELETQEEEIFEQRALLVQSLSHDFRTPLTVVHAIASVLRSRADLLAPDLRGYVDPLWRASSRMVDLTAVILAASEASDADQPSGLVDLTKLLEGLRALMPRAHDRVRISVDDDARQIITVKPVVRLLLRCLIDNATKFSGMDTVVEVEAVRHQGLVVIEILDRGPGMTEEEIGEAFEPFRQYDEGGVRALGGIGLGLFSADRLARRIGARIDLTPRDGGGLAARVSVPQRRATDLLDPPHPR